MCNFPPFSRTPGDSSRAKVVHHVRVVLPPSRPSVTMTTAHVPASLEFMGTAVRRAWMDTGTTDPSDVKVSVVKVTPYYIIV